MNRILQIGLYCFLTLLASLPSVELHAASRKSTSCIPKNSTKKPYIKKAPYAGYGKTSKVNGQAKTKIVGGHVKKTSKGYTYVNPYARSK